MCKTNENTDKTKNKKKHPQGTEREEEGYIPNILKKQEGNNNRKKKIISICKYYGHNITCPFENKFGRCLFIHCKYTRAAWQYAKKQLESRQTSEYKTIEMILRCGTNGDSLLTEGRKLLFEKYPRRPTDEEEKKAK